MQKMCRESGKGKLKRKRGRGGGEGLCSIAAVYIYVDFMSVCLSCLGITEIVRHFFVCLSIRVCVCECVCLPLFSRILYFNKLLPLVIFVCFHVFPPSLVSHLVYCVCFVAAARYAANNFI